MLSEKGEGVKVATGRHRGGGSSGGAQFGIEDVPEGIAK
jgi:hypothetical protein